jgi:hypothetical protein
MKAFPGNRFEGMELRDYFAAKAVQAIYSVYAQEASNQGWEIDWPERIAKSSYQMADAMMKAREINYG